MEPRLYELERQYPLPQNTQERVDGFKRYAAYTVAVLTPILYMIL